MEIAWCRLSLAVRSGGPGSGTCGAIWTTPAKSLIGKEIRFVGHAPCSRMQCGDTADRCRCVSIRRQPERSGSKSGPGSAGGMEVPEDAGAIPIQIVFKILIRVLTLAASGGPRGPPFSFVHSALSCSRFDVAEVRAAVRIEIFLERHPWPRVWISRQRWADRHPHALLTASSWGCGVGHGAAPRQLITRMTVSWGETIEIVCMTRPSVAPHIIHPMTQLAAPVDRWKSD